MFKSLTDGHIYGALGFTGPIYGTRISLKSFIITRFRTMPNADIPEQARNQAKARLRRLGITAQEFAKANKLSPSTVYAVLNGQKKCTRGESHRAAVLLGLKEGVILS